MSVRFRQLATPQIAIALQQSRLMILERLADSVDEHLLGRARSFERIARPDDDVGAATRNEASDLTAHADRLRRLRRDHRQRLSPGDSRRAGDALQPDPVAA